MLIVLRFLEICFFKAGPADVPASSWLLKLSLLSYFIISVMVNSFENGIFVSVAAAVAEVVILLLTMNILLQLTHFSHRFQQTVTALAGTSCCIGILALPIIMLFHFLASGVDVRITVLSVWLMILLMFWNLAVTAHIFKQAMALSTASAIAATIAYTLLLIIVVRVVITGLA